MNIFKKSIGLVMVLMLTIAIASTTTGCGNKPISDNLNIPAEKLEITEFKSEIPYEKIPSEVKGLNPWKLYYEPNCIRAFYRNKNFETMDDNVSSQVEFYYGENRESALGYVNVRHNYYDKAIITAFDEKVSGSVKYIKPLRTPKGYKLSHALVTIEPMIYRDIKAVDGKDYYYPAIASIINLFYDKVDESWEGFEELESNDMVPLIYQDLDIAQHFIESGTEVALPVEIQFPSLPMQDQYKEFFIGLTINGELFQTVKTRGKDIRTIRNFGFHPILTTDYREEWKHEVDMKNRATLENNTEIILRDVSVKFFDLDHKELKGQALNDFATEGSFEDLKDVSIERADLLSKMRATQNPNGKGQGFFFNYEPDNYVENDYSYIIKCTFNY